MENKFDINIAPSVDALKTFQNMSLTEWFALGEFIDNSLTSVMKFIWSADEELKNRFHSLYTDFSDYLLKVDISILREKIDGVIVEKLRISDNAFGITEEELRTRAFRVGIPPTDTSIGLSKHGAGMKIAALWFGEQINIESYPIGEDYGLVFAINIGQNSEVQPNVTVSKVDKKDKNLHGTTIAVSRLHENRKFGKIVCDKLSNYLPSIYRAFLKSRAGDDGSYPSYNFDNKIIPMRLTLDRGDTKPGQTPAPEDLVYLEPRMWSGPYWKDTSGPIHEEAYPYTWQDESPESCKIWKKKFSFKLSGKDGTSGKNISGWYGILEKGRKEASGFYLHYRNKGISGVEVNHTGAEAVSLGGNTSAGYKPKPIFDSQASASDSIVGVIDMSDFGKSLTTDQRNWTPEEEEEFLHLLYHDMRHAHPGLDYQPDFITMARKLRKRKSPADVDKSNNDIAETVKEINAKISGSPTPRSVSPSELEALESIVAPEMVNISDLDENQFIGKFESPIGIEYSFHIKFVANLKSKKIWEIKKLKRTDEEEVYDVYINEEHVGIRSDLVGAESKNLMFRVTLGYALASIFHTGLGESTSSAFDALGYYLHEALILERKDQ